MFSRTLRISGAGLVLAIAALFTLLPASAATQTISWVYPEDTPLSSISEPGVTFTLNEGRARTYSGTLQLFSETGPTTVTMTLDQPAADLEFVYGAFGLCSNPTSTVEILLGATVLQTITIWSCIADVITFPGVFDTVVFYAGKFAANDGLSVLPISFRSAGPQWAVSAKVGGGNVYNQFLPGYEPGTWSQKPVTVYLDCTPLDAPIDLLRRDRSTTFRDGEWYYGTSATDLCRDANGNVAEPVEDWGPILVDTKPPVCKLTPSTQYVARGTTQQVTFGLELSDATSGIYNYGGGISLVAGGAIPNEWSWPGDGVPDTVVIDVTMGSSTAGRVEFTAQVSDNAGHQSFCKAVIRAK